MIISSNSPRLQECNPRSWKEEQLRKIIIINYYLSNALAIEAKNMSDYSWYQREEPQRPRTLRSSGGQGRWAGQTLRVAIDELVSIGDEILTAPLVISLRYRPPVRVVPDRLALKLPSLLCVILIIARTTILFACTSFCSAIFKFINTVMALDWLNAYQNWLVTVNKSSSS